MIYTYYLATFVNKYDGQLTELEQLQYDTIIAESENGILNNLTPFTIFLVDASCKPPFFRPITVELTIDLTDVKKSLWRFLFHRGNWPTIKIDNIKFCACLLFSTKKFMFWVANPNRSNYRYKTTFIHTIATIERNRPELEEEWLRVRNDLTPNGQTIPDGMLQHFSRNVEPSD